MPTKRRESVAPDLAALASFRIALPIAEPTERPDHSARKPAGPVRPMTPRKLARRCRYRAAEAEACLIAMATMLRNATAARPGYVAPCDIEMAELLLRGVTDLREQLDCWLGPTRPPRWPRRPVAAAR